MTLTIHEATETIDRLTTRIHELIGTDYRDAAIDAASRAEAAGTRAEARAEDAQNAAQTAAQDVHDQLDNISTTTRGYRDYVAGQVEAIDTAFTDSIPPYLQPDSPGGLDETYGPVIMARFPRQAGDLDDTERFQRALDYCADNNLLFTAKGDPHYTGTYWLRQVSVPSTLTDLDLAGATCKRPNLGVAPYNMTTAQKKWVRMFHVSHAGDSDMPGLTIRNGVLDGNCWENWHADWELSRYAQEQASLLLVSASNTTEGRANVTIENMTFRDNVSDGIHIVRNTVARISDIHSIDCFRGGLTITGGNTRLVANNLIMESTHDLMTDGIDIEVDSPGHGESIFLDASISNVVIDRDLDIASPTGGSVTLSNVTMRKGGWIFSGGGILRLSNSRLIQDSTGIYYATGGKISASNVHFSADTPSGTLFPMVMARPQGGRLEFSDCEFEGGDRAIAGSGGSRADGTGGLEITIRGCTFRNGGDAMTNDPDSEQQFYPERVAIFGTRFLNAGRIANLVPYSSLRSELIISGVDVGANNTGLYIGNVDLVFLDQPTFRYGSQIKVSPGKSPVRYGSRTVYVDADPNDSTAHGATRLRGIMGDTAILREQGEGVLTRNPRTWTFAQFPNVPGQYIHYWEEVQRGRMVATSTARPPSPVVSNEPFFDQTLGKPIWWNGTAWVDATGADADAPPAGEEG